MIFCYYEWKRVCWIFKIWLMRIHQIARVLNITKMSTVVSIYVNFVSLIEDNSKKSLLTIRRSLNLISSSTAYTTKHHKNHHQTKKRVKVVFQSVSLQNIPWEDLGGNSWNLFQTLHRLGAREVGLVYHLLVQLSHILHRREQGAAFKPGRLVLIGHQLDIL